MEQLKAFLTSILPPSLAFLIAGLSADQFIENMATLAGIVSLVPIIGEAIKDKWNLANVSWGFMKAMRLITWVLSLALVAISWFVGWAFEGYDYIMLAAYGIGAGLAANGYFTIQTIKLLLAAIFNNK